MVPRSRAAVLLATGVLLGCSDSTGTGGLDRIEIQLTPAATTLMVNDTTQAVLLGFDRSDAPYPAGPVAWSSTDSTRLHVDPAGVVTALSRGSAMLIATVGDHRDSISLTIDGLRHSGLITTSETWTSADSPHGVKGPLQVSGFAEPILTIEAGATVVVGDLGSLTFGLNGGGGLRALGTAAAPVTIQSSGTPAGSWIGLTFLGTTQSELRHVLISDCGAARIDGQPPGCLVLGHPFKSARPVLTIDTVAVRAAKGAALVVQQDARLGAGSAGLSIQDVRGHVATLTPAALSDFPAGAVYAAVDTLEIIVTAGAVTESGTWDAGGAIVRVTGRVAIEGYSTPILTIPPGTTLRLEHAAGFSVGKTRPGGLRIGAPAGPPVTLRGINSSTWGDVAFFPFTVNSEIINATLESCGDFGESLYAGCVSIMGNGYGSNAAPVLNNVTVRNAVRLGVGLANGGRLGPGSGDLVITGTTPLGGLGYPISVYASPVWSIPPGTYTGNRHDMILLGYIQVIEDETWRNPGVPFHGVPSIGTFGIAVGPILTLEPGVSFVMPPGGGFGFGSYGMTGGIRALGTAEQPIVFTGELNQPGAWSGISIGDLADSRTLFDHVRIENAGGQQGSYLSSGVLVARDHGEIIRNSTVVRSSGCGITRMAGSVWTTDFTAPALGNTFVNNFGPAQCGP